MNIEVKIEVILSKFCFDNLFRKIKVIYHCFIIIDISYIYFYKNFFLCDNRKNI